MIVIGAFVFSNATFEVASLSFIIPLAECDLNMTNSDKGILSIAGYAGFILSSHLWGFLADTKGRRAVIVPTLLIGFIVTLLSSISSRFWMIALLKFVNGFFASASLATIYAYVGEFHLDRTRSRMIIGFSLASSISMIIFPIMAWGVINQSWSLPIPFLGIVYKPWRLFMIVSAIPGFLCGLALLLYPESPKFLLSVGRDMEAIEALKQMHKWNVWHGELQVDGIIPEKDTIVRDVNETKRETFLTSFLRTMWKQTVPLFQSSFIRSTLSICIIQFCFYGSIHGMITWFPYITDTMTELKNNNPGNKFSICDAIYAKQAYVHKTNGTIQCTERLEVSTYLYSSVMGALTSVALCLVVIIVNKVSNGRILFVIFVASGIAGLIAIHIQDYYLSISMCLIMLSCQSEVPLMAAVTADLFPTHLRSMALCIPVMAGRIGAVIGGYIFGVFFISNCTSMFNFSGVMLVICGLLTFIIPK